MISVLGAVFVLATFAAFLFRPEWLLWVLSAAVPFSATAAVTLPGQSIFTYPLVALVVILAACRGNQVQDFLGADVSARPGLRPLIAFGVWSVAVTAIAPVIFQGIPVLDPNQGIDNGVKAPAALVPALSNLAQAGYVAIGIATVIAVSTFRRLSPLLPAAAFSTGTILSSVRGLLPESAQKVLFDNSENVVYTAGEFNGVERMRGIFSEPAALGSFSVAATVFFLMTAARSSGVSRWSWFAFGCWAATNAVLSFSGGAVITGLVVLIVLGIQTTYSYVACRTKLSAISTVAALLGAAAGVAIGQRIFAFIVLLLDDKTNSSSYINRSAADNFSYSVYEQTYGVGAGLGSNRPSSFLPSLLSTTGLVGTLLFGCCIAIVGWWGIRNVRAQPTAWALVTIIVSKLTAGPDTSDPPMWFLLAVCAAIVWSERSQGGSIFTERDTMEQKPGGGGERPRVAQSFT